MRDYNILFHMGADKVKYIYTLTMFCYSYFPVITILIDKNKTV